MDANQAKFEGWAVVELFGRQKEAGFVTTQYYGNAAMFQLDVPELPEREYVLESPQWIDDSLAPVGSTVRKDVLPGRTRLISPSAVYALNPCTQQRALKVIEGSTRREIQIVKLPEGKQFDSCASAAGRGRRRLRRRRRVMTNPIHTATKQHKAQSTALYEADGRRRSALADGSKPVGLAGIQAVSADESRASADEIQDGERHSEGSELDHSSDLGGHSRYTRALVQPEGPSCGDEASSALYRGIVMVETREAHNLEVAGSNPAPATSSNSFPPSLCTLAREESYGGSDGMTVSAALVPLNSAGAAISRSEYPYPISPVRLLTLSSPQGESGAEQGATLVSAPGFLPRKFSWASDEDCESLAAAQAGEMPR